MDARLSAPSKGYATPTALGTELARLQALKELRTQDPCAQQRFDDLVWLAAQLCDAPIAALSLGAGERQWFMARLGLDTEHAPRGASFCAHAVAQEGCFEVRDARLDARFADIALVAGAPGIRFYAGVPLADSDGHCLGTLCVMDTRPRMLRGRQREGLSRLARRAADSLQTRLQRARAESRERTLARLLEAMPDAVVTCDAAGLLSEFNKAAREWHGLDPRAVSPQAWARYFNLYEVDGQTLLPTERIPLLRAWRGERVREAALVIRAAGQPPRTVLCNAEPLRSAEGRRLGAVCVMHDISARLAAEARLRESEHYMRTVADNVPALIAHVGADLRYRFVNRTYADWYGQPAQALLGRHVSEVMPREQLEHVAPRLQQVLAGETVAFDMDVVRRDGALRHMHATYVPDAPAAPAAAGASGASGERRCTGFHLMVHDLTEQTQLARVLHERAMTDDLTGLPNRAAWSQELARGVARAQRAGAPLAVMFLDLNGFKQVNDRHGHAAGDALLCEFARRLRGCLRRGDFIARLAGDEFVVLLDPATRPAACPRALAARVLRAMREPVHVDGHALRVMPSIGVAVHKSPAPDAALLMRKADEAMYTAKRSRGAGFAVVEC